jgi:hypothetical protein
MSSVASNSANLLNHFKNTNSILIICAVIVVLLAFIGYKFSKSFSCGIFVEKKISPKGQKAKEPCKIVTPQCVLGGLGPKKNVLVVNVLSEKMPVFIGIEEPDLNRSVSKETFELILKKHNGQLPKEIEMVYLMCAGWSCSAAKNDCTELSKRGVNTSRIVDYAGGLHEWCLYNRMNPNVFKLFQLPKEGENRIAELSPSEVFSLMSDTAHGYNTNTLIEKKEAPISNLCKDGVMLPSLLAPTNASPPNEQNSQPASVPESVPAPTPPTPTPQASPPAANNA